MSLKDIKHISEILRDVDEAKVIVMENSQAVTAFDVSVHMKELFASGVGHILLGEPYFNWEDIFNKIGDQTKYCEGSCPNLISSSDIKPFWRRLYDKTFVYPIPNWSLINFKNYWKLPYSHGPKHSRFFPILTSRGCPYPCDFCVVPETNSRLWRGREPDDVVEEMSVLSEAYGVKAFQIEDLNPTVNWKRFETICDKIIQKKLKIRFALVSGTKAETIPISGVPKLRAAGCDYISISPESGSTSTHKAIGKKFNLSHGIELVAACRRAKIATQACFLVGHPAEKEEENYLSLDYMRSLLGAGLSEVAIFIVAPFSGSRLSAENKIPIESKDSMVSFSSRGTHESFKFSLQRQKMIRDFLFFKLCRGALFIQGVRALTRCPQTKMENLPLRIVFLYWLIIKYRFTKMLSR